MGVNVGKIENKFHPRETSIILPGLIGDKELGASVSSFMFCSVLIRQHDWESLKRSYSGCTDRFERNSRGYPNFKSATRNLLGVIRLLFRLLCFDRRLRARQLSEAGTKCAHTGSQAGNPLNAKIGTGKDSGTEGAVAASAGHTAAIWSDEPPGCTTTCAAREISPVRKVGV